MKYLQISLMYQIFANEKVLILNGEGPSTPLRGCATMHRDVFNIKRLYSPCLYLKILRLPFMHKSFENLT